MLGIIAYILAFGEHPFAGKDKSAILNARLTYPKQGFMTDLIREMLSVNPRERPSAHYLVVKLST